MVSRLRCVGNYHRIIRGGAQPEIEPEIGIVLDAIVNFDSENVFAVYQRARGNAKNFQCGACASVRGGGIEINWPVWHSNAPNFLAIQIKDAAIAQVR